MGQLLNPVPEVITIGLGHSLMMGHMPTKIPNGEYGNLKMGNMDVESYGFFSSPDYNTFYPGVTKEDFSPKDEDFVKPEFRLLSEIIVNKTWNPVDFSKGGVLKASMKKLIGQTVNCDHSTDIANAIGSVEHTFWQDSFKQGNLEVPAGINGIFKIDAKANPRIARGLLMEPPSIHSNSVSIQFAWEKSHPKLDDDEFWNKLGGYDEKGELIRKVCCDIQAYQESSLVSHGADPFAQKVDNGGKIVLPSYTEGQQYSANHNGREYYFMDFKQMRDSPSSINNTRVFNMGSNQSQKNKNNMNEAIKLSVLLALGIFTLEEGKELNEANVIAALKAKAEEGKTAASEVVTLKAELATANSDLKKVKEEKDALTADQSMVELGRTYLGEYRTSVVETYKKVYDKESDENIIGMINTASLAQLKALSKTYTMELEKQFPNKCQDCGSVNISRTSVQLGEVGNGGTKEEPGDFRSILQNRASQRNKETNIFKDK